MTVHRPRQVDRIYAHLQLQEGLCAMEPLRWSPPIVRVAARIWDLRENGIVIEALHQCPEHGGADHAYYRLGGGRLF